MKLFHLFTQLLKLLCNINILIVGTVNYKTFLGYVNLAISSVVHLCLDYFWIAPVQIQALRVKQIVKCHLEAQITQITFKQFGKVWRWRKNACHTNYV